MKWVIPQYDRERVNQAAKVLRNPPSFTNQLGVAPEQLNQDHKREIREWIDKVVQYSLPVIGNWRSSHSFPLNTFKIGLLRKAVQIDENSLVAQRLKRLSSITAKLHRFPEMKLSQMQDIAGCRAIVSSVSDAYKLVKLYKESDIKHKLVHQDDYIQAPKQSGYRSIHLIYGYYSDRKTTYNGLKVEVQIRSALQHAWATAVETVGIFIQQALKSSQGEKDWLRFFELMGTAIAIREQTPRVPNTPAETAALKEELRHFTKKLNVEGHLTSYAEALKTPQAVGPTDAHYFLLDLDTTTKVVKITGYKSAELEKASSDYATIERDIIAGQGWRDAVLVSVDSIEALKKAYPNYFLDTHRFIEAVNLAMV